MENPYINHLAVFVCALLSLVAAGCGIAGCSSSKPGRRKTMSDEQVAKPSIKTYSLTLILAGAFLTTSLSFWATVKRMAVGAHGRTAGRGGLGADVLIISLFEQRSFKYMLINCGYITVYFGLIGFVLGIWR